MTTIKTHSFFFPTEEQLKHIHQSAALFLNAPIERVLLEALKYKVNDQMEVYNPLLLLKEEDMTVVYKDFKDGTISTLLDECDIQATCIYVPFHRFVNNEAIQLTNFGASIVRFTVFDNLTCNLELTLSALFETDPSNPSFVRLSQVLSKAGGTHVIYYETNPPIARIKQ